MVAASHGEKRALDHDIVVTETQVPDPLKRKY